MRVYAVSEQRICDVKYREDELNRSLEEIKIETEAALEMRARVDKMIEALQELLHISQQCLVKRSPNVAYQSVDNICIAPHTKNMDGAELNNQCKNVQ